MDLFSFIKSLNIGLKQKFQIFLVMYGFKDVSRIDIYDGNENLTAIKGALLKAGLKFSSMRCSENPKHICGLAIAKTKDLAFEFCQVNISNNHEEVLRLYGEQIDLPIKMDKNHYQIVKTMGKETPLFFLELSMHKQIQAA